MSGRLHPLSSTELTEHSTPTRNGPARFETFDNL